MDKADIKKLKESGVFGPLTFWVTEIKNLEETTGNTSPGVRDSHGCVLCAFSHLHHICTYCTAHGTCIATE